MSTGRLKDQKDFDLEQIVQVIDAALESDDQRIKDALRALMTVTVLCTAEHPDQAIKGPLARLQEDYNNLNQRLSSVENDIRKLQWDQQKKNVEPFTPPYQPPGRPWTGTNPNSPTPMWGPSWSSIDADIKKWSAGDNPEYKGSSATTLAEDFLKELENK
jgi:hypothetical protein